jgi:DNA-binding response OmpR family regulator
MPSLPRVLVVDDEHPLRELVRDVLAASGYAVEVAAGANEALELAKAHAFDLAVVDFVLRGAATGEQLAEILARLGVRVIMTSGSPELEGRLSRLPYPFLMKPFRFAALMSLVAKTMRSHSSGGN